MSKEQFHQQGYAMAFKMIVLFLLAMLHAEHAMADANEATKVYKAMSKFMPAIQARPRVASPPKLDYVSGARSPVADPSAMLNTMADLEARTQEMKVEYQRLQARIEKLSQTDVESSVGLPTPFHWIVGLVASIGLAASVGVAAVRKYTAQNQQGSESTTVSQISLPLVPQAPQRAGPIVAVESADVNARDILLPWDPETRMNGKPWKPPVREDTGLNPVDPKQKGRDAVAMDNLKALAKDLNPVIGYFDPLGLSRQDYWNAGADAQIAFLRHAEIKHGRVAMAGFIGFLIHENHIHWPWKMTGSMPDDNWYKPFEDLSAADIWFNYPWEGRLQIILFMGLFEIWSEASFVLKNDGMKHYMRGGKPGYFPSFDLVPHPCPLNLYDPGNFNGAKSDEWKAKKLVSELNNGRLAMIGLMSLLVESKAPGAIPLLSAAGLGDGKDLISPMSPSIAVMAPFGVACAPVSQFQIFQLWGGTGACPVETITSPLWPYGAGGDFATKAAEVAAQVAGGS